MNKQEINKAIETLASFDGTKDRDLQRAAEIAVPLLQRELKALTQQLNNGWIPVSERLPEHNKHVLLYLRNGDGKEIQVVGYLYFSDKEELKAYNNEFSAFDGNSMPEFMVQRYVKAWMPLPEPYKEENYD